MRVLHVLEALRGGTSRHVLDAVRWTSGVDHHVATPGPDRDNPGAGSPADRAALVAMRAAGATVHELAMRRVPWDPSNAVALGRLRRLTAGLRPDVVHGHSSIGGALARLASVGAPHRVVYTANGVATGRPYVLAERGLGRLTDRWVAVSQSEADLARRMRLVPAERLVVVPNGIDVEETLAGAPDLRRTLGVSPTTPLVGTIVRLVAQKSPATFVQVCASVAERVPAAHFVLIGQGPLQREVDAEVARCGLGGRWHQIDHLEQAAGVLGQLDVFVLASAFEGGPYTPLEAMRAGTPVVLTDVVGNRDAVEDGVSGFLRQAGDIAGIGRAVEHLLHDPDLAGTVVGAARERLRSRFDVRDMGARLGDLYRLLA